MSTPWWPDSRLAVLDFETTGGGPDARATEIGIVLLDGGEISTQFSSLMHSGATVPPFIERLTGISNAMLDAAPPIREVMQQAEQLCQGRLLVAHNASFDRSFWQRELQRCGVDASSQAFACTVKLARRVYPEAPNCKLGTLAAWQQLPPAGRAHRALADALTTARLLQRMAECLWQQLQEPLSAELLLQLQALPPARWSAAVQRVRKHRHQQLQARQQALAW